MTDNAKPTITLTGIRAALAEYDTTYQTCEVNSTGDGNMWIRYRAAMNELERISPEALRALLAVVEAAKALYEERSSIRIEDISDEGLKAWHALMGASEALEE